MKKIKFVVIAIFISVALSGNCIAEDRTKYDITGYEIGMTPSTIIEEIQKRYDGVEISKNTIDIDHKFFKIEKWNKFIVLRQPTVVYPNNVYSLSPNPLNNNELIGMERTLSFQTGAGPAYDDIVARIKDKYGEPTWEKKKDSGLTMMWSSTNYIPGKEDFIQYNSELQRLCRPDDAVYLDLPDGSKYGEVLIYNVNTTVNKSVWQIRACTSDMIKKMEIRKEIKERIENAIERAKAKSKEIRL